ncbi:MAG: thioredoxin family protein [Kiritimatiellae bacterium]|nr:thioredoxin family protein [Kiritimatiellia bacterium]
MNRARVLVAVAGAVAVAVLARQVRLSRPSVRLGEIGFVAAGPAVPPGELPPPAGCPRLLDFGAGHCVPCKMMIAVLDELQRELRGKLVVEAHDVITDKATAQRYDVRIIPTQIFLAPDGRELFRHEGYMAKEEILQKWAELGYRW